ncbi:nitrogen fixation protein NifB [Desulfobotulus alkaliphilus]|uniref:FeMo cofactor biosynthesis protein NifB n=1 Tax=Desulfobotulus alkaliphilus TaxID=622671 RepID=A0A562RI00_9BACT|nr:nitrogenase cofactor biosynthesis protein NifB [Desulfobotulus alkaliphilus]TWI68134.1 nitrogen fixation protein NifB [Desulfobotulus alkaliphilus]
MSSIFDNHPCFNKAARKTHGRVHLPVAPRCNIQCRFCDRKFDCVNESRPGVASGILSPYQALVYLDHVFAEKKNISVVGIAGPGDPFANAGETLETLRLVRQQYPDILLCLATNGLGIGPYIEELADLKVSHVTLTMNAVDPEIASRIYAWVRHEKRVRQALEGSEILLEKQSEALIRLKSHGIAVKVNSILIPGVNEDHIPEVARTAASLGADIFNCIPYYPNPGSAFGHLEEPGKDLVQRIRAASAIHLPQMTHCTRCRADAVGCLGEQESPGLMAKLKACEAMPKLPDNHRPAKEDSCRILSPKRPFIAVASREGILVNQHLGEAESLLIFREQDGNFELVDTRITPAKGGGESRWEDMAALLSDCRMLLVSGIGERPKTVLLQAGVDVAEVEGLIEAALTPAFSGASLMHLKTRSIKACSGAGAGGCGA